MDRRCTFGGGWAARAVVQVGGDENSGASREKPVMEKRMDLDESERRANGFCFGLSRCSSGGGR